jgi:hypothetical protein
VAGACRILSLSEEGADCNRLYELQNLFDSLILPWLLLLLSVSVWVDLSAVVAEEDVYSYTFVRSEQQRYMMIQITLVYATSNSRRKRSNPSM